MHLVAALDTVPGVRAVLGLHETVCSGAADGYGRMAHRPALTLLHLGPGLANALANLHNARRAGTPVVNLIGGAGIGGAGRDGRAGGWEGRLLLWSPQTIAVPERMLKGTGLPCSMCTLRGVPRSSTRRRQATWPPGTRRPTLCSTWTYQPWLPLCPRRCAALLAWLGPPRRAREQCARSPRREACSVASLSAV